MGVGVAIPGLYLAKGPESREWASSPSEVKRRHFVLDRQKLKLFGRRGKTYKGVINLLSVEALRPTTDATAPLGSLELQMRSSSRSQDTLVCILARMHQNLALTRTRTRTLASTLTCARPQRRPLVRGATYGYSLYYIRLQPRSHTVTGSRPQRRRLVHGAWAVFTRTSMSRSLRTVRSGYAYQPPACGYVPRAQGILPRGGRCYT